MSAWLFWRGQLCPIRFEKTKRKCFYAAFIQQLCPERPKLTYGAAVRDLSAAEKHRYNVAVNNAVRRIFGFRQWQSIRQLRKFYNYNSIEIMFANAHKRFYASVANHSNKLLRSLYMMVEVAD